MGQHFSPPTHAAILLSSEGVFASIASYLFLGETLSSRELSGCVLMLCATMITKLGCCLDFAVAEAEKTMYSNANGGSLAGESTNGSGGSGAGGHAGLLEAGVVVAVPVEVTALVEAVEDTTAPSAVPCG